MAFAHPNDGQYAIGCNLDSADLSSMYWWIGDGGGNVYPTIIPGEPDYHVLSTPLTGTHQLVCGVNASGGDGRLFSYRVMPPWTSRAGWKATAKVGADTAYAFDGEDTTRWTTNQHEGRELPRARMDRGGRHWELEGPDAFSPLLRSLEGWLPEDSILYFEGAMTSPEIQSHLAPLSVPPRARVIKQTRTKRASRSVGRAATGGRVRR